MLGLLFSGCKQCQDYDPPLMDIPDYWSSEVPKGLHNCSIEGFIWWQSLKDPILDSLIEQAKCQNLDLYMAAMRILQAREVIQGDKGSHLPHIDGTISDNYVRFNQKTLNRILDSHSDRSVRQFNLFEAGFDAEWEIDLFGVNANKLKSLQNLAEASEEDFRQIELTLVAEVVRNYVELRGGQLKLQLMDKQIELQKELCTLISGLVYAGFMGDGEDKKAQEQLQLLLAKKPEVELSIKKSIHRLSVLLGYSPNVLYAELLKIRPLPKLPYQTPIGVPSELLRYRPDIRKAEKELASSLALVDSSIAELFPRLSLKGFLGDFSVLGSNSFTVFAGPQLFLPLFNSKLITQSIEINKAKAKEACYGYQKTVLEALEEVENGLSAFNAEWKKREYFSQALKSGSEAFTSTSQLYEQGFKDFRQVLESHQNLLDLQNIYLQNQMDMLLRYIALYKSLGGGWDEQWCQEIDPST